MSNQRPPGGVDSPTEDPDRERNKPSGGAPPERHYAPAEFQPPPQRPPASPQPWVDPERTQPYVPGRRSIAERLRQQSREPEAVPPPQPAGPQPAAQPTPPPAEPPKPAAKPGWQARAQQRAHAQVRSGSRALRGMRLVAILAGVVVLGLAAGAGAAWFSGWRPGFLASKTDETKPPDTTSTTKPGEKPDDKPGDKPPESKPGETTPPATDLARSCFTARTEAKAGATACGFALEASGAVSFKGQRITDRLAAGTAPAQRLLLYPFSPSGRFVFLRACATASGGRCAVQRLVDTKERKLFDVKGDADDLRWVAFSPKEEVGLLGYRDGTADSIAAIGTADGKLLLSAAIKSARNEYAMVHERSLRWPDENSFSIEVKLCAFERGGRNAKCEQDEKARFRRRLVKLAR